MCPHHSPDLIQKSNNSKYFKSRTQDLKTAKTERLMSLQNTDIQRWNEWRRILCDIKVVAPTDISKIEIKKIQNTNKSITEAPDASSQVKIFWSAPIYINPWPNWKNIFGFTIALSSESTNFLKFCDLLFWPVRKCVLNKLQQYGCSHKQVVYSNHANIFVEKMVSLRL